MTDEEIQELWAKANNWDVVGFSSTMDDLRRFTNAVLAEERENAKLDKMILQQFKEAKDQAYEERNKLVALLASMFPSGRRKTSIAGWGKEWHNCVYIDFPWGQASWHYHDSQAWMFSHLPPYKREWDGHTTDEKYAAIMEQAKKPQTSSPAALRREANRPWDDKASY